MKMTDEENIQLIKYYLAGVIGIVLAMIVYYLLH